MFEQVKERFPKYAMFGFLTAAYARLCGNNFGVEGIYNKALNITDMEAATIMRRKYETGGMLAFFLPSILGPLSFMVLGIQLFRARKFKLY